MGFMDYRPAGFIKGTSTVSPIIYDGTGQQLIALSHSGGITTLEGAEAVSDDLKLKANSTNDYPYIQLHGGDGNILLRASERVKFYKELTPMLETSYASNVTTIEGSYLSGDDLTLKANSTDATPYISLLGNGDIIADLPSNHYFTIKEGGSDVFYITENGNGINLTTISNRDIYLNAGTGKLRFGAYTAGAATDSIGYITIKDGGGTIRKVMIQA